jgi:hypothetical protein
MDLNLDFEREIQKQVREREIYNIQTVFFNLLSNIKDAITGTPPHNSASINQ